VGYLGSGYPSDRSSPLYSHLFEALEDGLREEGYVDGQTVTIEYRFAEGRYERFPDLATDLVRLDVDVIFASTERSAVSARQATQTMPIVFNAVADPIASRFAASLSRPGGNMTGLTQPGPQVTEKLMGFVVEAVPNVARVAVLRNPTTPSVSYRLHRDAAEKAAQTLRLRTQAFDARSLQEFDRVFVAIAKARAQAMLVLPDATFYVQRERLADLALRHRLPMFANRGEFARSGGLMAYGSVLSAEWRRVGVLVGKILKGAKPRDIPIEQPATFELVVNLRTATALGLAVPKSVLLQADHVME
jgi:putative ABC transport system substrate-binding protein